ncbi:MAG: peptidylprolyl isomerase [Oscillospiraceae bacterium]|nr:peptidylprolyl isomerase [Oscillospiraceae bacterium]
MKKCEFCQAELAEDSAVCPACGKENATVVSEETVAEPAAEQNVEAACAEKTVEETAAEETAAEEAEEGSSEETAEATEEEASEEAEADEETAADEEAAEDAEEEEPVKKATAGKIAAAVVAVIVLAAILIGLIMSGMTKPETPAADNAQGNAVVQGTIPPDGNPDDVTCKGSYSVSDEEAVANSNVVVATIGEHTLTNGQLQVYYWSMVSQFLNSEYGYYMMMYGVMDYTRPLDTQVCAEDQTLTWQQYFLKEALNYWQLSLGLAVEGEKAGVPVSAEDQATLDALPANLEATAASYGMTVDTLLLKSLGAGASLEDYMYFQNLYCQGKGFYQAELAKFVPTDADLEAYYTAHEDGYLQSGITKDAKYVDVRHILIMVDGGTADATGNVTYSEADWENCRVAAQEVLDLWLAGDKTEDSFAALANEKSADGGSNTNGGLYQNVYVGQMVPPFEEWCFDANRQYGDYGLVRTDYGYHIMFFVGSKPVWKTYAENDWITEQAGLFIEGLTANYPMTVDYSKINLGVITFG